MMIFHLLRGRRSATSLFILTLLTLAATPAASLVFTVNSESDLGDANLGDGVCQTESDVPQCTLRAAITEANNSEGPDEIHFTEPFDQVAPFHIIFKPATPYHAIQETLLIDGYTAPGWEGGGDFPKPVVIISGLYTTTGSGFLVASTAPNSTIQGLTINDFPTHGIITSADGTTVQGCWIGINGTGTGASPNGRQGIQLQSDSNIIGPKNTGLIFSGYGNVISGNAGFGIFIKGDDNSVVRNRIGTNPAGTAAIGNGVRGVDVVTGTNNKIGSYIYQTTLGSIRKIPGGNLISGNVSGGIYVGPDSNGNSIQANSIGLDADGAPLLDSNATGINIAGDTNLIGGLLSIAANTIGGNGTAGISLSGKGNQVYGNWIGTDADVSDLGNQEYGIIDSGSANFIGGSQAGAGNVIGFNGNSGIMLSGHESLIEGNSIGIHPNGDTPIGNAGSGVYAQLGTGNSIGSIGAGANIIAYNGEDGVRVNDPRTEGNTIVGNEIFGNKGLAIDLQADGFTPNDPGDTDEGPNALQNFPEIISSSANEDIGSLLIEYSVETDPASVVNVDFYLLDAKDDGGPYYIGSDSVPTKALGISRIQGFAAPMLVPVFNGDYIVATATDAAGNTSEFSPAFQVPEPGLAQGLAAALLTLAGLRLRCAKGRLRN